RAVDAEEEVQVPTQDDVVQENVIEEVATERVKSSEDVENVFNQGRMSVDMETDKAIKLEVDQEKDARVKGRHADSQAEIYNIDLD
nr:hypothetical protein [Tanacetum cinerariifolium]